MKIHNIIHALLLIVSINVSNAAEDHRPAQPNIVIMMADDMGIGDTSAYLGVRLAPDAEPISRTLRTPNLDSFGREGLLFTDAYAPASMCSATRYSLLTGRFAHRSYLKHQGWLPHGPNTPMIQRALSTLPEMLQSVGYRTAAIGKYHVGMAFDDGTGQPADDFDYQDVDFTLPLLDGPTHHGFHEFFGVPGNTEDPLDTEPRVFIRNDRWTFTNRAAMKRIGMKNRAGRILAAPDWDLAQLGPRYLAEARDFLKRQADSKQPFFLYYVPNANHYQRHPSGDYAVPETLSGIPIKGQSRYSDGAPGDDRTDMIHENDTAFGLLLAQLRDTPDPRWPGHQLIENTLVIFTSDNGPNVGDNLGRNKESGGLRGKKAKIWEGGIRVPFLVSWPRVLEGGQQSRSIVSLTDLYATLARVVGHTLTFEEAQDSHDVFDHWTGKATTADERPRIFFCHLGPPHLNDVLALRMGRKKLIAEGGLALPSMSKGTAGGSVPKAVYDLHKNLYEDDRQSVQTDKPEAESMAALLLEIHNRGHARDLNLKDEDPLILTEGWHHLRNDINGEIGFEFRLRSGQEAKTVTHLGMWDDHDRDVPVRAARAIPTEHTSDVPARFEKNGKPRRLHANHTVRLINLDADPPIEVVSSEFTVGQNTGLAGAFRYQELPQPIELKVDTRYALLMSTRAGDGDHFRDPASFDGLSPLIHPHIQVLRSLMYRDRDLSHPSPIPAFADLNESYSQHRLPVGPNLRFR